MSRRSGRVLAGPLDNAASNRRAETTDNAADFKRRRRSLEPSSMKKQATTSSDNNTRCACHDANRLIKDSRVYRPLLLSVRRERVCSLLERTVVTDERQLANYFTRTTAISQKQMTKIVIRSSLFLTISLTKYPYCRILLGDRLCAISTNFLILCKGPLRSIANTDCASEWTGGLSIQMHSLVLAMLLNMYSKFEMHASSVPKTRQGS